MFALKSARDFYAMAIEDFDYFMEDPSSTRRAIHSAISLYHLREWMWHDLLENDPSLRQKIGIKTEADFNGWVTRCCVWFAGIRDLTNGTKHFREYEGIKTDLIQGYGNGPYGVGPYGAGYLLIDYGEDAAEHQYQLAAHLLEVVLRFWRDVFRSLLPHTDIPSSKHHVD